MGNRVERIADVGVAGLHRILAGSKRFSARMLIVVAGMERASSGSGIGEQAGHRRPDERGL